MHSKTNQDGKLDETVLKPVTGRATEALKAWLAAGGITDGPIFRRILKGGKVIDEALDAESVRKIVQKAVYRRIWSANSQRTRCARDSSPRRAVSRCPPPRRCG